MLVSGRQAVRILLSEGAVTGEAQARALLRTGAAGRGVLTDTGIFFDSEDVRALARRPWLDNQSQSTVCPDGMYLARVARDTTVDLTRPWPEVAASVDRVPTMPAMTGALLVVLLTVAEHRLPWVATLHGFVVVGADLTGFRTGDEGVRRFELEPPGAWFAAWVHRRVRSSRGGRPWVIALPRAS